jgi:hypothetical protein
MNYEEKLAKYVQCRATIAKINELAKVKIKEVQKVMDAIEAEITAAADEEGLDKIPTSVGTGYWSELHSCKLTNPEEFVAFVREHDAFHMIDKRANKTAVREHLKDFGELPPGVELSSYRKFNVREK